MTNGQIKPSKHITFGSALKSLSSSKKIVNIVYRYGHICSYDVTQNLETEGTYTVSGTDTRCSSEVLREKGIRTVCVFDIFDRFVDSVSGKVTMNDTVGIVIQDLQNNDLQSIVNHGEEPVNDGNHVEVDSENVSDLTTADSTVVVGTKRRSYKGEVEEVPRYVKKIKMIDILLPTDSPLRQVIPNDLEKFNNFDLLWVMSHFLGVETPMWVGFNAKVIFHTSKKQTVSYLTPINESPTDISVVMKTLQRTQTIANKCNEPYAQVTYDLYIGKIAMSLKSTEKEVLKNVFVHLGTFHIEMALFKAIGSFIDGCGLTNVMVETGLIGSGSIATF